MIDGPRTKHPLYGTWQAMIQRCTNPKQPNWKDYGGRGIAVCDRWRFDFEAFISDMGSRPDGMSIDRINNDGNYEPGNCRWATAKEQAANSRPRSSMPWTPRRARPASRRRGRPTLDGVEKSRRFELLATEEDKARWQSAADREGQSLSEWLRAAAELAVARGSTR